MIIMKRIVFVLAAIMITCAACTHTAGETPVSINPGENPFAGNWVLTQTQSPGTGGPGVWSTANPSGQTMILHDGGKISGTAFPSATGYTFADSATVKMIDPSVSYGYRLFTVDLKQLVLLFYIKQPNGVLCYEGCGGYRFER